MQVHIRKPLSPDIWKQFSQELFFDLVHAPKYESLKNETIFYVTREVSGGGGKNTFLKIISQYI